MLKYQLFPRSAALTNQIRQVIGCFELVYDEIKSPENKLKSDDVLHVLRPHLEKVEFLVESGKTREEKIPVPVLFGLNDGVDKSFNADGISKDRKAVLEIEAGRAVANFAFLKDIFEACMMRGVEYLILAVRNDYKGRKDFEIVYTFLETLYVSGRLILPLKGILLIGY